MIDIHLKRFGPHNTTKFINFCYRNNLYAQLFTDNTWRLNELDSLEHQTLNALNKEGIKYAEAR